MRVVIDTNIWISGLLLPKSAAGLLLKKWQEAQFDLVTSPEILAEIGRVLAYPKIEKRLRWGSEKITQYLEFLSFFTEVTILDQPFVPVDRDPKDSPILTTLVTSRADCLVTGDKDLLCLNRQYAILTLSQFLEKIGA